jgi:hypothetical protein
MDGYQLLAKAFKPNNQNLFIDQSCPSYPGSFSRTTFDAQFLSPNPPNQNNLKADIEDSKHRDTKTFWDLQ